MCAKSERKEMEILDILHFCEMHLKESTKKNMFIISLNNIEIKTINVKCKKLWDTIIKNNCGEHNL